MCCDGLFLFRDQVFEMKICYSEQDEDDEPIKHTFKVGDTIVGLFKATVKIKKVIKVIAGY